MRWRSRGASAAWRPVNRRRVEGKGWHVDAGPGFPIDGDRTPLGDRRQACVLLVLLSDWPASGGGTCFAVGSHETVAEKICGEGAVTQDALNRWAIAEGRAGLADGRWKLDYEGRGAVRVEQVYHRRDLEHTFFQTDVHKVCSKISAIFSHFSEI